MIRKGRLSCCIEIWIRTFELEEDQDEDGEGSGYEIMKDMHELAYKIYYEEEGSR